MDQKVEWLSLASMKSQFCPVIPSTCPKMLLLAWPLLLNLVHWQSFPHKTAALSLTPLSPVDRIDHGNIILLEVRFTPQQFTRHVVVRICMWNVRCNSKWSTPALEWSSFPALLLFYSYHSLFLLLYIELEFTYQKERDHRWHLPLLEKGFGTVHSALLEQ